MILIKKFTENDILKILIDHAANSLPDEAQGTLEARYRDDDSVEIYFIQRTIGTEKVLS
jgi:hypothetical protein